MLYFIHSILLLFNLQEFTSKYREQLSELNVKGIEMNDNYRELLVRHIFIYVFVCADIHG